MQFSIRKPHFWHPQTFAKTLLWHNVTLFVFSQMPQNTITKSGNSENNLDQFLTLDLDQFLTLDLDQFLTQESPNLGPVFNSTAYIYIYICCRVENLSKNALLWVENLPNISSLFFGFCFSKSSSFCRENDIFSKN